MEVTAVMAAAAVQRRPVPLARMRVPVVQQPPVLVVLLLRALRLAVPLLQALRLAVLRLPVRVAPLPAAVARLLVPVARLLVLVVPRAVRAAPVARVADQLVLAALALSSLR